MFYRAKLILEHGFDISGVDLSEEMPEKFNYIFIPSGSISLITDMNVCRIILQKMKDLLAPGGKFVFAVDTVFDRCNEDSE